MKIANTKFKKTIIVAIGFIIITIIIAISLVSPIAKYLIEKYDEEYSGRPITLDWVYLNPFTGFVHISNLKIYEAKGLNSLKKADSLFFSVKGVSANFAMLKLLTKTIEITEITLDQPKGIIIQNKKLLNLPDKMEFTHYLIIVFITHKLNNLNKSSEIQW